MPSLRHILHSVSHHASSRPSNLRTQSNYTKLQLITIRRYNIQNNIKSTSTPTPCINNAPCKPITVNKMHTSTSMPALNTLHLYNDKPSIIEFKGYTLVKHYASDVINTLHESRQQTNDKSNHTNSSNNSFYYTPINKKKLLLGMFTVTASTVAATVDTEAHADTAHNNLGDDESYELIELNQSNNTINKLSDSVDDLLCKPFNEIKTCRSPIPNINQQYFNNHTTDLLGQQTIIDINNELNKLSPNSNTVSRAYSTSYSSVRSSIDERSLTELIELGNSSNTSTISLSKRELYSSTRYYELGQLISNNTNIEYVKLDNCSINETDIAALKDGLQDGMQSHIHSVDIGHTNIGESQQVGML